MFSAINSRFYFLRHCFLLIEYEFLISYKRISYILLEHNIRTY